MEVAAWREQEAQSRDVPRSRVLKDDAVGDIATHAPPAWSGLQACRSLPKGLTVRMGRRYHRRRAARHRPRPASRPRSKNNATTPMALRSSNC